MPIEYAQNLIDMSVKYPEYEELVDNFVSDSITTDVTKTSDAYTITLSAQNGTDFIVGEVVTSSGGGIATVLEWDSENDLLYVGPFTSTAWVATNTLTAPSGATGTIASGGVSSAYTWYTEASNVEYLKSARSITSNIAGQVSGTNLWTNPEAFGTNWTETVSYTHLTLPTKRIV